MRIYGDINRLATNPRDFVIQVGPTPPVGTETTVNGKFVLEVPEGCTVPDPLPTTVAGLLSNIYGQYLRSYPNYVGVHGNALLTTADQGELDLGATFPYDPGPPARSWSVRAVLGRSGSSPAGLAPNGLQVLPLNDKAVPPKPGLVVTDTIDVSAVVPGGVTEALVWWKVFTITTTEDRVDYTSPTGANTPAYRVLREVDQEPTGWEVHLSTNNGGGYQRVSRARPVVGLTPGTDLRLAFVNSGSDSIYLASYVVLYR